MTEFDAQIRIEESELYRMGELMTELNKLREQEELTDALDLHEDDGQPDEYIEWQDLYGGDDWDHGQYDEF